MYIFTNQKTLNTAVLDFLQDLPKNNYCKSNVWGKSEKSSEYLNLNNCENDKTKKISNFNSSILSFHITDYEKSDKSSNKFITEQKTFKEFLVNLKHNILHLPTPTYEFLRQQNNENSKPEVMEFKASQQMFNVNKPSKSEILYTDDESDEELRFKPARLFSPTNAFRKQPTSSFASSSNHTNFAVSKPNVDTNDTKTISTQKTSEKKSDKSGMKKHDQTEQLKAFIDSKPTEERNNKINFSGVKEGDSYEYDAKDVTFAYNNNEINLYNNGQNVQFSDFENATGKPEFQFYDYRFLYNLRKLNIVTMRPIQIAATQAVFFENTNAQRPADFIGISNTGSGKSHAFLLPVLQKCLNHFFNNGFNKERSPSALIFVHSTSLAEAIYQKAMEIVEGTSVVVKLIVGKQEYIKDSKFDLAICSIGRFSHHFYDHNSGFKINLQSLKYVVIDEADTLAKTPEFLPLFNSLKKISNFTTLAFCATHSSSIMALMDNENFYAFRHGTPNVVAPSVKQIFWPVDSHSASKIVGALTGNVEVVGYKQGEISNPFDAIYFGLKGKLLQEPGKRVVIFVKRTAVADNISRRLTLYGINAVTAHSDQSPELRNRCLTSFIEGKVNVLVATNLLTRGTDIQVDYVINYDLPEMYSEYVHRCGRTGRNKQTGVAITCIDLNNPTDYAKSVIEQIILNFHGKLPQFLIEYAENVKKINRMKKAEK